MKQTNKQLDGIKPTPNEEPLKITESGKRALEELGFIVDKNKQIKATGNSVDKLEGIKPTTIERKGVVVKDYVEHLLSLGDKKEIKEKLNKYSKEQIELALKQKIENASQEELLEANAWIKGYECCEEEFSNKLEQLKKDIDEEIECNNAIHFDRVRYELGLEVLKEKIEEMKL